VTTITATANPALGTVSLSIVKTEAITTIIRADANGTRPVRLQAGALPSLGTSGTLNVTDHEASFAGPVSYRAGTAEPVWTQFPAGMLPRITLPVQPYSAAWVENIHGYDSTRESAATIHYALGREFPLIVHDVMHARQGKLEMIVPTHAAALELELILARGRTCHLRQANHAGLDMYFYPINSQKEPEEELWKVTADYVEVQFPEDDRAPNGWDFAALAALPGASFATVAQDFASFPDLAAGESE